MARTSIWAFQPLAELNGETGLVECDEEVAKQLIAEGRAQDPRVGALHLKEIEATPRAYNTTHLEPEEQYTTDLTPPKGRRRTR